MVKPLYRIPSMQDIQALPWNGIRVVSTFAGCGGSCLGYRMAGCKVIWANEFVPAAVASYRANMHADCMLDSRDIRRVSVEDILLTTGLHVGDIDILDGSPPCQAFSMAGKRAKGWGKAKRYAHGATQKNETLFTEYIRLVRGLQPKVFVAENVSGLVKGVAKGFFKEILRDLKACGYRVEARLLDAQWLGVPQMRQRIIFQGVRQDLCQQPAWPKPLHYRYSVREALPYLGSITGRTGSQFMRVSSNLDRPMHAILTQDPAQTRYEVSQAVSGARVIHDTGGFVRNHDVTDQPCPSITNGIGGLNSYHYQVVWDESRKEEHIVTDDPARTERSRRAGTLMIEGANGFNGHASSSMNVPMPTVQAGRPVHVMHRPQETTCVRRKFTIAELKRICAFPDDFILVGSYAQQWERLGNSVPPIMMYHVAKVIVENIFQSANVLTCKQ